jgi:hypothetical protein
MTSAKDVSTKEATTGRLDVSMGMNVIGMGRKNTAQVNVNVKNSRGRLNEEKTKRFS